MIRTILAGSLLAIALGSAPAVSLGQNGTGQTLSTPREALPIRIAGQKQPWMNCPRKPDSQTAKTPTPESTASIGVASMTKQGTIVLDLRSEGSGGMIAEAHLLYPPGHKDYCATLEHLGGLRPGEHKAVPPWPDAKK
jgi:hypothetical protein